jgi:hypothetical protein
MLVIQALLTQAVAVAAAQLMAPARLARVALAVRAS